jgi:glycine/D-amino acid oxidase-like deaminating enzyme/nitrite reductase/ring-hydroxylating ferredoxin subunit
MNVLEERSRPLWLDDAPEIAGASGSPRGAKADVIVIGAGIAGLSVAYELARGGRSVLVLDRGAIARGMTARTTAHLASELDDFYAELGKRRSTDEAKLYAESQNAAIASIETIVRDERISCDFARVDGFLFAPTRDRVEELDDEYEAARQAGMAVSWAERAPMSGYDTGRCLRFADQARIHPLKYLAGLARAITARGGRLYADAPVKGVEEKDDGVIVTLADGGEVRAGYAVVAANTPFNDRVAIHTKQAPYRTYAMAFEAPKGAIADALLWDTLDPYHYVRVQPGEKRDTLIVGGEDHKTGMADDADVRFANLEAWARERFPEMDGQTHRWSGQVYEPVDFLPYIGVNPGNERVFVVTGDSGQGMTMGATAGLLLPDLIEGREHRWAEMFKPSRKSLSSALTYIDENKDVVANLSEYVAGKTKGSVADIAPGEGALVRDGAKILAVYRAASGDLQIRSATCTHIGCVVHWNSFETCWDCPCHGSQFSPDGEVLQGPAFTPLAEADAPDERPRRDEDRPRA